MATCDVCGEYENLPYQCRRCGRTFCGEHRLPENHDCPGLRGSNDPGAVFESTVGGVDRGGVATGTGRSSDAGIVDRVKRRVDRETGRGNVMSRFRGKATYVLLAAMWFTLLGQWAALAVGGSALHNRLFVLESYALWQVWTWGTAVFAHDPGLLFHIIGNSIVLFFFGPLVERAVGSKRFVGFFLVAGVLAGLGHVLFVLATGGVVGVLGASGATFAILGVLTVWRPNMQILLFFVVPMKLKYLTWGIAAVSAFLVVSTGAAGVGGIAHLAHLIGFAIGLAFGKRNVNLARRTGGVGGVRASGVGGPGGPRGPGGPGGRF
ncbi:rhomboid family intramembrane serine protease [Halorubrum sp. JWXQ-INN 858]|uniref:rhomboid family intramembrane serine protease n=1 Tax=Halorubrum sp. JWXQ-INN 858 TaxID=2690782 RepID=UPI00135AC42D|nr:rhomboid family intramembrane serine protease [Halorubrum sp. JWXQ-INN 858]MWV65598.1 rhomboid family intramembrane serine protease [Halorubrum sp. JWXQ-INN 858]